MVARGVPNEPNFHSHFWIQREAGLNYGKGVYTGSIIAHGVGHNSTSIHYNTSGSITVGHYGAIHPQAKHEFRPPSSVFPRLPEAKIRPLIQQLWTKWLQLLTINPYRGGYQNYQRVHPVHRQKF